MQHTFVIHCDNIAFSVTTSVLMHEITNFIISNYILHNHYSVLEVSA
jgi:hypothetical protein